MGKRFLLNYWIENIHIKNYIYIYIFKIFINSKEFQFYLKIFIWQDLFKSKLKSDDYIFWKINIYIYNDMFKK